MITQTPVILPLPISGKIPLDTFGITGRESTWRDGKYACAPLLKAAVIGQLDDGGKAQLWKDLELNGEDDRSAGLRANFSTDGIPLPPNFIAAGTVNMDETTHGFSRKVIDRALTIDFSEFYRNRLVEFFAPKTRSRILGFPTLSQADLESLKTVQADPDGEKTIRFLESVNGILSGTPFELAYRAVNEALLAAVCFSPPNEVSLQAVWDDFMMMKVLPRIEGDAERLGFQDKASLLTQLADCLKRELSLIAEADRRPDLLIEPAAGGEPLQTSCRSIRKLEWMQKRLEANSFTTFWP
ncbi:MAG: hypothetical protein KA419_08770 [Acidobacteria bacterium]|nr:hypothetical protein [Acidobacteriota bacterium]